jgi:hypothetical protein
MKTCSKCGFEYADDMFEYNRRQCKNCRKEIMKNQNAKYYQENKESLSEYHKIYVQDNEKELKEYRQNYRQENKEYISNYQRQWYNENRGEVRVVKREYQKERKKNDPSFKLRSNISTLISCALNDRNSSKNGESCLQYLPYSFKELKQHLEKQFEPWMTWENYGRYDATLWNDDDNSTWTWNIDHIIPQSDLPYSDMSEDNFKKCWALENLRPYSAKQNLIDGTNKSRHSSNA